MVRTHVRLLVLLALGMGLIAGPALAGPVLADPAPVPAPGAPSPAPVTPSPTPTPAPGVPSPIPTPPAGAPTPSVPSSPPTSASSPGPSPAPAPTTDDGEPGMFDIPGQIRKAINEFLLWVAKTGLRPVMDALGATVLSTPDVTGNAQVKAMWTTSLVAANGIYVLFVVLGAFIVASRETVQSSYGFKEIAPRLAMGAVGSNVSLIVCGKAIEMANALTVAIAGQGVDGPSAAKAIAGILDQPLTDINSNMLFALLVIAVAVLGVVVVVTFLLRVALLVVLIGIAPLALTCHATPQTEGIAYAWWRAFAACLGLQVAQAVVVLGTVKVFLTPSGLVLLGVSDTASGLLGVLVCVTMLWLLIKLPGLMKQYVLAPLGLRSQGRGLVGQLLQAYVMFKTFGAAAGIIGGGGKGARPRAAARPRPTTGTGAATGTRSARPVPAPRGQAARPSPAAPVAFSNAPVTQTPLSAPAGTNGAPTFSNPPQPGTPAPAPTGPAPAAPFSHPQAPQPPSARSGAEPHTGRTATSGNVLQPAGVAERAAPTPGPGHTGVLLRATHPETTTHGGPETHHRALARHACRSAGDPADLEPANAAASGDPDDSARTTGDPAPGAPVAASAHGQHHAGLPTGAAVPARVRPVPAVPVPACRVPAARAAPSARR
jgi:hypothetical protein